MCRLGPVLCETFTVKLRALSSVRVGFVTRRLLFALHMADRKLKDRWEEACSKLQADPNKLQFLGAPWRLLPSGTERDLQRVSVMHIRVGAMLSSVMSTGALIEKVGGQLPHLDVSPQVKWGW